MSVKLKSWLEHETDRLIALIAAVERAIVPKVRRRGGRAIPEC